MDHENEMRGAHFTLYATPLVVSGLLLAGVSISDVLLWFSSEHETHGHVFSLCSSVDMFFSQLFSFSSFLITIHYQIVQGDNERILL
jgi:hypothetical protein